MEESVSPELAQAPEPEPEPSQDPVNTSSQEPTSVSEVIQDQKDQGDDSEDKIEEPEKSTKPSREFKKTWGFRRTTIAKREIPGDMAAETPEGKGAPVRRSGRQAKRTDKLEEFLVTVKRGRGSGRKSCPSRIDGGDPPSQTPTDAETASEASFDGNAEAKTEERKVASPVKRKRGRGRLRRTAKPKASGGSVSDDGSSENEEEGDGEMMKQEHVETAASAEDGMDVESKEEEQGMDVKEEIEKEEENDESKEKSSDESISRRPPTRAFNKESKKDIKPIAGAKLHKDDADEEEDDDEEEEEESSSSESDSDGYDPNALYCICRQKHNKRFMICCDRCEEWFHGDCVGITEARGRLMERNGEDYVCPNCNTHKGQISKAGSSPAAAENGKRPASGPRKAEPSPSNTAAVASDEKAAEDLGIKGRIEKAANPSGKKKIKIFQPQVTADKRSSLPKCIGPGCGRDALPDSVYCGNDCILKHAAAAMKIITTDGKDSKQKEKSKPKQQKKTTNKLAHKKSGSERRSSNQDEEEESGTEEDEDDDEDEHAEEHPPPAAMSSWSSDHNYMAVTPEKTSPISTSVLNKACMYLSEGFPHFIDLSLPVNCQKQYSDIVAA